MSGSSIPGTLSKLVTLFRAAIPPTAEVAVIDGPAYDPPANFLSVGWDRVDVAGVSASNDVGDFARSQGRETYDVSVLLSYSYDAAEVTTVRVAMFEVFGLLDAALTADHTLGGTVLQAVITDYELTPILTEAGTVADLRFTVHVDAFK